MEEFNEKADCEDGEDEDDVDKGDVENREEVVDTDGYANDDEYGEYVCGLFDIS